MAPALTRDTSAGMDLAAQIDEMWETGVLSAAANPRGAQAYAAGR